jgi:hypothetical protein
MKLIFNESESKHEAIRVVQKSLNFFLLMIAQLKERINFFGHFFEGRKQDLLFDVEEEI